MFIITTIQISAISENINFKFNPKNRYSNLKRLPQ